jgi:nicotinamidase-related amidase
MNNAKSAGPALLLIDFQKGFDNIEYWGGHRNNPNAEENANGLLGLWRENGLPVFHIMHCSTNPASPLHETNVGNQFKDSLKPMSHEHVIKKNVHSAFIGTNLKELIHGLRITKLVMIGLTTDHCISTSARMAENFGFDTFIVSDATATFNKKGLQGQVYTAELIHDTALASLNKEFATIVSTDLLKWRISLKDFDFGVPSSATIIQNKDWVAEAVNIHQSKLLAS